MDVCLVHDNGTASGAFSNYIVSELVWLLQRSVTLLRCYDSPFALNAAF